MQKNSIVQWMFIAIVVSGIDDLNIAYGSAGVLSEAYFFPFVVSFLIMMIGGLFGKKYDIYNSKWLFKDLIILLIISVFCSLCNINNIIETEWKGHSGIGRFVSNIILIIYDIILCYVFVYVLQCVKNPISFVYRGIKYGSVLIIAYGFIQIAAVHGNGMAFQVMLYMNNLFTSNVSLESSDAVWRVYSFRQEASDFGVYLAAVIPWICLGRLYLDKTLSATFLLCSLVILTFYSSSRLAYVIVGAELIVIWMVYNHGLSIFQQIKHYIIGGLIMLALGVVFFDQLTEIGAVLLTLQEGGGRDTSNITRFAMQVAAWNAFTDNIFTGVGIGQFKMIAHNYLPSWGYVSVEIMNVASGGTPGSFYGAWNTYLRILAELGIFGFFIWGHIIVKTVMIYVKRYRVANREDKNIILLLLVSFGGALLSLVNFDTITSFYFWLMISLAVSLRRGV